MAVKIPIVIKVIIGLIIIIILTILASVYFSASAKAVYATNVFAPKKTINSNQSQLSWKSGLRFMNGKYIITGSAKRNRFKLLVEYFATNFFCRAAYVAHDKAAVKVINTPKL